MEEESRVRRIIREEKERMGSKSFCNDGLEGSCEKSKFEREPLKERIVEAIINNKPMKDRIRAAQNILEAIDYLADMADGKAD